MKRLLCTLFITLIAVASAPATAQTLRGGAGMTHNTPGAVMVFASVCNSLGTLGGYVAARAGEPA